ncbi:hypothetical protein [Leeia aquatica]|uniref:Uncharacterized protein n=1 Tax=Leeia aquatica TaxID=2725557 RepID=A0A847SB39_9NEIS|nr:hypothetical protein [Leeia aquatica]NLR74549.1 hypothetical protein [Leeia aquatica]
MTRYFCLILSLWLLTPLLAHADTPPNATMGLYSQRVRLCPDGNSAAAACTDVVSWLLVTPESVHFQLRLPQGQTCANPYEGAYWGGFASPSGRMQKVVFDDPYLKQKCTLQLHFSKGQVTLSDPKGECTKLLCRTGGKLDGQRLPRRSGIW